MDCQNIQHRFQTEPPDSTLDELDAEILEHLHSCKACQEEYRESKEAWLLLSGSLPTSPISAALENQVMSSITSTKAVVQPVYSQQAKIFRYALAAAVLFFLVALTFLRGNQNGAQLSDNDINQMRSIAKQMEKLDELQRTFAEPTLRYVSLESNVSITGFLLHDPDSAQLHFLGSGLGSEKNEFYYIWIFDEVGSVIHKTEVERTSNGRFGAAVISLGELEEKAESLAVSVEESRAPSEPSSNVIFQNTIPSY